MEVAFGGQQYATMWDHSPYTYVSAYFAMITGIVCTALTLRQWEGIKGEIWGLCMQTASMCFFQGLGFGMAGIAFHIVDTRADDGQYVHTDIWGTDSGWIFAWMFAVICKPLCSGCLLGACAAYVGTTVHRFRAAQCANCLGLVVAIFEVYLILVNDTWKTATAEIIWGVLATGLACTAVLIAGWRQVGMWWIFSGLAVRLAGYLYAVFGPCTLSDAVAQGECPFPVDPIKNVVFNVLVAISVIPFYYGAVLKSRKDLDYQNLLVAEAAAKIPKADTRSCCTGWGK